jgi:hypothetical protein
MGLYDAHFDDANHTSEKVKESDEWKMGYADGKGS